MVEAWARLLAEIVMAEYVLEVDVVILHQYEAQINKRCVLCIGASVFRFSVGTFATDVADADRCGVVAFAMSSNIFYRSASFDCAIAVYDEVIAYTLPSALAVPAVDVLDCEVFALWCIGAMNDYAVNLSHYSHRSDNSTS